MTVRLVVADDQSVVRDGLMLLLSTDPGFDVVAVARDGREAVELSLLERPDVLLCDLRMPGRDGAQVTAALAGQLPETRVLIMTTFADDEAVLAALRAGAAGYLTKDTTGEDLVSAVRAVAAGRAVLDPAVQQRLVELLRAPETSSPAAVARTPEPAPDLPDGLTRREVDVVRLVSDGLFNQQIARRLVVSEATVKTHLNHVLSKLDVDGRAGLVRGRGGTASSSRRSERVGTEAGPGVGVALVGADPGRRAAEQAEQCNGPGQGPIRSRSWPAVGIVRR